MEDTKGWSMLVYCCEWSVVDWRSGNSRAWEENQQVMLEFLNKMKLNMTNLNLGLQDTDVSKANWDFVAGETSRKTNSSKSAWSGDTKAKSQSNAKSTKQRVPTLRITTVRARSTEILVLSTFNQKSHWVTFDHTHSLSRVVIEK